MVYKDHDLNQSIPYRRFEHPAIIERLELGFLCTGNFTANEKDKVRKKNKQEILTSF